MVGHSPAGEDHDGKDGERQAVNRSGSQSEATPLHYLSQEVGPRNVFKHPTCEAKDADVRTGLLICWCSTKQNYKKQKHKQVASQLKTKTKTKNCYQSCDKNKLVAERIPDLEAGSEQSSQFQTTSLYCSPSWSKEEPDLDPLKFA